MDLQRATLDGQSDVARVNRGMSIRRAKKRVNVVNDKRIKICITRFDIHPAAVPAGCTASAPTLTVCVHKWTPIRIPATRWDDVPAAAAAAPTAVDGNSAAAATPAAILTPPVVDCMLRSVSGITEGPAHCASTVRSLPFLQGLRGPNNQSGTLVPAVSQPMDLYIIHDSGVHAQPHYIAAAYVLTVMHVKCSEISCNVK